MCDIGFPSERPPGAQGKLGLCPENVPNSFKDEKKEGCLRDLKKVEIPKEWGKNEKYDTFWEWHCL